MMFSVLALTTLLVSAVLAQQTRPTNCTFTQSVLPTFATNPTTTFYESTTTSTSSLNCDGCDRLTLFLLQSQTIRTRLTIFITQAWDVTATVTNKLTTSTTFACIPTASPSATSTSSASASAAGTPLPSA
ncbi:MAG: hypothetical protein M1832_002101 [Thelocarpon impressellum]|nr:MAG: hypothetical protein M1832_002101 [Thelocarpon impressellum]